MEKTGITVHCIVRNEDHFVWFAIQSVLPYVDRILVYDTGSTDKTVDAVMSIGSSKIIFSQKGTADQDRLVLLRQEMVAATTTPFFLILDGDEVWPEESIKKMVETAQTLPANKIAVVCRTRNCVGDIWHYLPEETGQYHLAGQIGNLSMRLFRNVPGLLLSGQYPLENYTYGGGSLNNQNDKLEFLDAWYLHATHLPRSTSSVPVLGFRKSKLETGMAFSKAELPAILSADRPSFVPDPLVRRSYWYELAAKAVTPIKQLIRKFR